MSTAVVKKENSIKRSTVLKSYLPYMSKYKVSIFVIFLLSIVWNILEVYIPIYLLKITKELEFSGSKFNFEQVRPLFNILLYIFISKWAVRRLEEFVSDDFYSKIGYDIRVNVFDKIIKKNHNFFINNFAGSLLSKINRYVGTFYDVTTSFFEKLVPFIIKTFGIIAAISFIDGKYSKLLIIFSVFFTVISYYLVRSKEKAQLEASKAESEVSGVMADSITNQSSIQFFNAYDHELESIKKVSLDLKIKNRKNWFSWIRVGMVQTFLANVLQLTVLFYSFKDFENGILTLAAIFIVREFTEKIMDRLWDVQRIIRTFQQGFGQAYELVEALNTADSISDSTNAIHVDGFKDKFEFKDVVYVYENNDKKVLEGFNLTIPINQKVGLVGLSGGGKTTIVKLLLRLFDVTGGSIKIDDVDLRDIKQGSLRELVSYVPQDTSLFHRSIMDNIKYGKPTSTIEEIHTAAKKAHIHDFIMALKDGYDTMVGERGVKLSGGERQRIAIARAILKNSPILVLDEATSALDSETEQNIQEALNELMQGKTVIAIAHRLSTIRKMDRILVVSDGQIVEDGSHDELLTNNSGLYKSLWDMQAGGFIKEDNEEAIIEPDFEE